MYIKILWSQVGLLKQEIKAHSDVYIPEGLQFKLEHSSDVYDRKTWMFSIMQHGKVIIRTDGNSYIDYVALGKRYIKHVYTIKDVINTIRNCLIKDKKNQINWGVETFYFGDEKIIFNVLIKKEIRHLPYIAGEVFFDSNVSCLLYEGYEKGGRYCKIESEEDVDHVIALGAVAYRWVEAEYQSHITG